MLVGGALVMVVGVLVGFFSLGGGAFGVALGLPAGAAIFALGAMLAIAGAIVNAIEAHKNAVLAESRAARDDFKVGIKSLWDQLDRVRTNTEQGAPIPVYGTTPIQHKTQ
ncbi:hypothetical protein [Reyranella massiliensis]|uniref:hypothetical protein n=1 Tax=Reyranella massiliensis TaxID=445220 RepID=UPI0005C29542|nr:hypothetical protein [Reyranella massiliensis]